MLKAALIGVGVMLACFVPPIVHFVSGPLSPAIGGFVVGLRLRCRLNRAAAVAALMAGLLLIVAGVAALVASIVVPTLLPSVHWTVLAAVVVVAYVYVFWLAMLGAWAGGSMTRRSEQASASAGQSDRAVGPEPDDTDLPRR